MSTRVQKGSTTFRPVTKPRPRQVSVVPHLVTTESTTARALAATPAPSTGNVLATVPTPAPVSVALSASASSAALVATTPAPSAATLNAPNVVSSEEIDPTVVTMADLCSDPGHGKVSSKAAQIVTNHATWKSSNRAKRARMKTVMEAKKYGRKGEGDDIQPANADSQTESLRDAQSASSSTASGNVPNGSEDNGAIVDESGSGFDYSQTLSTSRFNVQIRIGPNGETIIDEDSLFVDRAEGEDTENYTHVEESDTSKFVNSATYGKKYRGSRWSAEETELFYNALSQFGENYELISYILPGRDRKACKNKFKAEDKKDPNRITYCLTHKIPYDMQTLSRMTGKDFSGPTPEIRAPTPLRLGEPEATVEAPQRDSRRKQSSTPGLNNGEEVIGHVAAFEDD